MSEIKVWKIGSERHGWRLVAARSQKSAAAALGVTIATVRQFATQNHIEQADRDLAIAHEGRVFSTKANWDPRRGPNPFDLEK